MEEINQKSGGLKKVLYIVVGIIVLLIAGYFLYNSREKAPITSDINTVSNEKKWPQDWPSDIPTYTNAIIISEGFIDKEAYEKGLEVVLSTPDSKKTVINFYKDKLTDLGWMSIVPGKTIKDIKTGSDTSIIAKKDNRSVTVFVTDLGGKEIRVNIIRATTPDIK